MRDRTTHPSTELAAALALAEDGVPVFPCHSAPEDTAIDKKPVTWHGFYDATTDLRRIRRWWWRGRLIGVPTGAATGFVALDVDPDGLSWLDDNRRRMPHTRIHKTWRGGEHWLFACRDAELRNSGGGIVTGVDVRGFNRGYVIWWPAHGCEIVNDVPLDRLAVWPRWLNELAPKSPPREPLPPPAADDVQAMDRYRSYGLETLRHAVRKVAAAPEGTRNQTLNSMTFMVSEYICPGGLGIDEVTDAMRIAAREAGEVEHKIASTIRSALIARGIVT